MKNNGLFRRYNDISREYIYTDKHIHSKWSDGKAGIKQIIKKAEALCLNQLAITEHIRGDSTYFSAYADDIKSIKTKLPLKVYIGFEAKIKNFKGEIDAPQSVLKKAQIRIASVHRFPIGNSLYAPGRFEKKICQQIELDLSIAALRKKSCNVLGHPGGMSLVTYGDFPLAFFEKIISECRNNNIAFELNSTYHAGIYRKLEPLLRRYNPFVSLGSDAHKIEDICGWLKLLKKKCKK
jgi:histidinol phosphatase-like PHP family hydrolase